MLGPSSANPGAVTDSRLGLWQGHGGRRCLHPIQGRRHLSGKEWCGKGEQDSNMGKSRATSGLTAKSTEREED